MKYLKLLLGLSLMFSLVSCDEGGGENPPEVNATPVGIIPNAEFQTIAGFGGADGIFNGISPSAGDVSRAFGTGADDLGMTIFRIKVPYDPADWPGLLGAAQEVMKYPDVKIIASPWSPPPALKSNGNPVGGRLLSENYQAFVDHLNEYLAFMQSNGVDIYAISIQNEPDIQVSYESCDWTENEILNFVRDYGDQVNTRLMAAESFNFNQNYTNPILADAEAVNNFDIVAGHIYGGGLSDYPLAEEKGKEIWMTEYLMNLNTGNPGAPAWTTYTDEQIWNESLNMLSSINEAMSNNWNAYIWWYLKRYYSFLGDGTQNTSSGEILKRGVAFSHFSKFIRPGYVRIDLQASEPTSLEMTAYKGDNRIVVIAINRNSQGVPNIALSVDGATISSATAYTSSLALDRNMQELEVVDESAIVSFTRSSVTTIVLDL